MAGATAHTDIVSTGGLVRRLPPALRPYALLARVDRPIGTWLLLLPGWWGILLGRAPLGRTLTLAALFAIGAFAMRSAGCVVNDMWDRDIDREVERTRGRPLASGLLGMTEAAIFLALLLALSLAVLLALPPVTWVMATGSLVLVALYPLAKRVTWWPQLVMGLPFGFGAPMGVVAAGAPILRVAAGAPVRHVASGAGLLDAPAGAPLPHAHAGVPVLAASAGHLALVAVLAYAAAIAWDLGFDTIYGFQDMEDDARVGVRSTSRRFATRPRRFVGTAYALALALLALAMRSASFPLPTLLLLLFPAILLLRQVRALDPRSPPLCLLLFRANREVGLAVALVLALARLA